MYPKINLYSLIGLLDLEKVSKPYVKYLMNFETIRRYRQEELQSIKILLETLNLNYEASSGFYYSILLSNLNKELDLLKITKNACIDIELKSQSVSLDKMKKQLIQNRYYLKLLNKPIYLFTFIANERKLYSLRNDDFIEVNPLELKKLLIKNIDSMDIDFNSIYSPIHLLVSPIKNPEQFLKGKYLLTENQQRIKNLLIKGIGKNNYFVLNGASGTGKTMLIYDICKTINMKSLIIKKKLELGDFIIKRRISNLEIVDIAHLENHPYKAVFIDETNKFNLNELNEILSLFKNSTIIFSLDLKQMNEFFKLNMSIIDSLNPIYLKLTTSLWQNKNIKRFISSLFDLKQHPYIDYTDFSFSYIDEAHLKEKIKENIDQGYSYISYELNMDGENGLLTNIYSKKNDEFKFEKICMVLDDHFYYENNLLKSQKLDEFYYHYLLFLSLQRSYKSISLIVTNKKLIEPLLLVFKQ